MVEPGARLKLDFTVQAVRDGKAAAAVFQDLLRRRTIVSVHMKNNTPSCDRQVASLAAEAGEFARLGYDIVALSRDTAGAHCRYSLAKGIPFTLVSDPADRFAAAANSLVEKSMYGRKYTGPARAVFVLSADGTVLARAEKVDTAAHAAQVRELIRGLGPATGQ